MGRKHQPGRFNFIPTVHNSPDVGGGRKLRADQLGVFPGWPREQVPTERDRVLGRVFAQRAGLLPPEERDKTYENLGNRELPVHKEKAKIQKMIRDHQISMVEGPTGCGKSTQVGQYALEMGYAKIVHLAPRVLLADNLADRIQYELSEQLGAEESEALIGVRHSERSTGYGKRMEIMTPDTFLRVFEELNTRADEPVLIIGDEIHEKDFATESAVAVAAQELENHPKWRLVLMSATLDADSIRSAYGEASGRDVPCVSVEGRPFKLEIVERPDLTITEAYQEYQADHKKALGFTAGKQDIKDVTNDLRALKLGHTRITPLHAKLSQRQIKRATHAVLAEGEKQVIPCTNAAQSGITIPELTLVISDGTIRRPDLDMDGTEGLFRTYCAQDEMIQQGGRAGRDVEGGMLVIVKPDDPSFDFVPLDRRAKHAPAQIYHTNISRNVLAVAALGRDFHELNRRWLINKVHKPERVLEAFDVLYRLGALDEQNSITALGHEMNKFPVRPELSRALVQAVHAKAEAGRVRQLAAMISAVGAGGLPYFERGVGEAWRKDIRSDTKDDYTAQLDMFLATRQFYKDREVNEAALQTRNYDLQNTRKAHRTYDKICERLGLNPADLPDTPTPEQVEELHRYLTAGLFDYTHRRMSPDASNRRATYVDVQDGRGSDKHRELSDRGTYKGDDPLVIGFPRRFEKYAGGGLREFSVIEDVFPTTRESLAQAALWLAKHVPQPPRLKQGRIEQRRIQMFGDVALGEAAVSSVSLQHTPESKALLKRGAFEKPTQTLAELKEIKRRLEWLARRVRREDMAQYFPHGIMTDEWLQAQVDAVITEDVESIYDLDNALRQVVVRRGITIEAWISDDKIREIHDRSPETVSLRNGQVYTVFYTHGVPLINGFNLRDADVLPEAWYLSDGREIMINYSTGRDTKWCTASEIRQIVHGEDTSTLADGYDELYGDEAKKRPLRKWRK